MLVFWCAIYVFSSYNWRTEDDFTSVETLLCCNSVRCDLSQFEYCSRVPIREFQVSTRGFQVHIRGSRGFQVLIRDSIILHTKHVYGSHMSCENAENSIVYDSTNINTFYETDFC